MSKRSTLKSLLLLGVALLASCHREVAEPTVGAYRATLTLPGGEAPFGLEVAREEGNYVLYLVNGTERTRVPDVQVQNQELRAHFQGYENTLEAKLFRDRLEGNVTLIKAGGVLQVIPFEAKLGDGSRFYSKPSTDNADVAGRWRVKFTEDDGTTSDAVAELSQSHDRVSGTVLTPTGDHRFLEGQVHGDELMLSTFAGGLAYFYKLRVAKGGELQGDYWQGLKEHVRVQADRDAAAQYTVANTELKEGAKLAFTFRDVDGKQVSLDDERFRNKVVIVTLGGTWCPNCHDEAEFLEPFYKAHRGEGFEVLGLMLERHPEFEQSAAAVKRFQQDFGIEYTLLIAGVSDKDEASKSLPFLKEVLGYPTALFIDRKGVVRKIHTGFSGPATGEHYEHYKEEFTTFVTALLHERA
jgi:thiol-disulfide isomerase/thioredoxin